jgi:hypothetical protein
MQEYRPQGCPLGESRTRSGECVSRHQKNCPDGQVWIPDVGGWQGRGPGRKYVKNMGACMKPVAISPGNMKTGGIPTWSIPSGITCPSKTPLCETFCYAKKAEIAYPQVMPSRMRNLWASQQDEFVDWMTEAISKIKSKFIRVHESGDFYDNQYKKKWFEIMRRFPNIKFLAYTKNCSWSWNDIPPNLILRCSIWPDTKAKNKKSDLIKAYAYDPYGVKMPSYSFNGGAVECPALKNKSIKCSDCKMCWRGKRDVKFKLH